jgi:hypothetical protein
MGINALLYLAQGLSYWKVKIRGRKKELSELDTSFDLQRGVRPVDWILDVVGSGDNTRIEEITLCTPQGEVKMPIHEPRTAFQFKRGTMDILSNQRIIQAQIIGRLENRETGLCTACIWDVAGHDQYSTEGVLLPEKKHLYLDFVTYIDGKIGFQAWHEDIVPIGAMSRTVIGV